MERLLAAQNLLIHPFEVVVIYYFVVYTAFYMRHSVKVLATVAQCSTLSCVCHVAIIY